MIWIQVSAGLGPDECCLVVAKVAKLLSAEARVKQTDLQLIESIEGERSETYRSILFSIAEEELPHWLNHWIGTIRWIANSPYRPNHRRKNWFVSIQIIEPPPAVDFRLEDLRIETCRSSGPGGQHVNKTESAVRATHIPTNLVAVSQDERSQHGNRKLAIERLRRKVQVANDNQKASIRKELQQQHSMLERGNAVKTFTEANY
ncbi:MAG: peptide chain release factor H [Candidatus Obscuribacterales bacterium]|jgi:peptide chain release factor